MGKLHNECRDGNAYDSFHLGQLYIFNLSVVGLEAQCFFFPAWRCFWYGKGTWDLSDTLYKKDLCCLVFVSFFWGGGGKGWVLTWVLARCTWGLCNLELTYSCLCLCAYPKVNRCRINSPITLLGGGFNYFWILTRKSAETIQFWLAAYVSNGWWKTSTIYTWHDDSSSLSTW